MFKYAHTGHNTYIDQYLLTPKIDLIYHTVLYIWKANTLIIFQDYAIQIHVYLFEAGDCFNILSKWVSSTNRTLTLKAGARVR